MGRKRVLDHDQILDLYAMGYSPREIADKVSCHPDYVSLLVRRAGKARPAGRPKYRWVCQDCGSANTKRVILGDES